jgi:hypothetical protein
LFFSTTIRRSIATAGTSFVSNELITKHLYPWWFISVILWLSVLLVKEIGVPGENHRPVTAHWQTLSHNVVHLALIEIRTHNISGDRQIAQVVVNGDTSSRSYDNWFLIFTCTSNYRFSIYMTNRRTHNTKVRGKCQ